jgi:hypothetical protein
MNTEKPQEANVVSLSSFRQKKTEEEGLSRGRKPLYVSHKDGKVTGSPHLKTPANKSADFGDRVSRIRASLDRINVLMSELKKMSANSSKDQTASSKK